jgi:hypothetical protein
MNQQAMAIVIAGALIAAAIMLTNHWTAINSQFLLNRWTGTITYCSTPSSENYEVHCPAERPLNPSEWESVPGQSR